MEKKIVIRYSDRDTESTKVDLETICPHCGIPIDPSVLSAESNSLKSELEGTFAVILSCTNSNCEKYHIQAFSYTRANVNYTISVGDRIKYSYKPLLKNDLPQEIRDTFPEFDQVYNQALEAESMGLDQIAGLGFRKSLEFLIKSFAIRKEPESEESIKKESLNNTIQNRYKELPRIQNLLELSAWIGNDEAHFVRKHTSLDIQTMKRFIRSASMFISGELDFEFSDEYVTREKERIKAEKQTKQNQDK